MAIETGKTIDITPSDKYTDWTAVYSSRAGEFEDAAAEVRARALRDVPDASVEIDDNWPLPKGGFGFRLRRVRGVEEKT